MALSHRETDAVRRITKPTTQHFTVAGGSADLDLVLTRTDFDKAASPSGGRRRQIDVVVLGFVSIEPLCCGPEQLERRSDRRLIRAAV